MRRLLSALALLTLGAAPMPTHSPLPDASPTLRGAVTPNAQAFGGRKNFTGGVESVHVDAGTVRSTVVLAGHVDAGSILVNGVPVASVATAPLVLSNGELTCVYADENIAGCVRGTPGQVQAFSGIKLFKESASFAGAGAYVPSAGLYAGIDAYNGIATGGPIFPNTQGLGLILMGRRRDLVAQVVVGSEAWIDGGSLFQVNLPQPCGFGTSPMLAVTTEGVLFGTNADRTCSSTGNLYQGALVDNGGVAGHYSMLAGAKLSLTYAGNLSGNKTAIETDGGKPVAGSYATGVVGTLSDGGTFFNYAGRHGAVIASTIEEMKQGLIFQVDNVNRATGNHVFYVTHWGSFGQDDQITFNNFPAAVSPLILTSEGQYIYGYAGELAHDRNIDGDESTGHWRNRHSFADGGQAWVTMVDTSQFKSGTCTLDGAAPAKCSATLPKPNANCSCSGKGTTPAVAAAGCAFSVTGYTATFYSANGLTHDVGYVCY